MQKWVLLRPETIIELRELIQWVRNRVFRNRDGCTFTNATNESGKACPYYGSPHVEPCASSSRMIATT
jgi:hypothetical protein